MTSLPWVEEDRAEFVESIVEGMISEMTFEEMRQCVWDMLYEDLLFQEWSDLCMHAEQYAPDLLNEMDKVG